MLDDVSANKSLFGNEPETPSIRPLVWRSARVGHLLPTRAGPGYRHALTESDASARGPRVAVGTRLGGYFARGPHALAPGRRPWLRLPAPAPAPAPGSRPGPRPRPRLPDRGPAPGPRGDCRGWYMLHRR